MSNNWCRIVLTMTVILIRRYLLPFNYNILYIIGFVIDVYIDAGL